MSPCCSILKKPPLCPSPDDAARRARALLAGLGHDFADPKLLEEALTHRSAGAGHNERLEFLGDAVLSLVAAGELYRRRPNAPEGDLSRLRAALVRERTLAEIAGEVDLGAHLRMGAGERRSGGFRRASTLADGLESVIGAIYLDAGFGAAQTLVLRLLQSRLDTLPDADSLKDPKTRLQEWLQGRSRPLPHYTLIDSSGAPHVRRFVVRCALADAPEHSDGEGSGRRRAEQAAAAAMLQRLAGGST